MKLYDGPTHGASSVLQYGKLKLCCLRRRHEKGGHEERVARGITGERSFPEL
jgi:hypothetical protein